MTRVRIGVAYRRQEADDKRIAVSIRVEFRRRREGQKYSEESGEQAGMKCNRPVGKAHDIAPAPRHAGHARAGRLPETLDKQHDAALPLGCHDAFPIDAVVTADATIGAVEAVSRPFDPLAVLVMEALDLRAVEGEQ